MSYDDELNTFPAISAHLDDVRAETVFVKTMDGVIDRLIPVAQAALPIGMTLLEGIQPAGPIGTKIIEAFGKAGEDALARWDARRKGAR